VLSLAERFARYDAPVLIRGQTGTGKELFARLVHYLSRRRGNPFVPINCGALPDSLVESELFGHSKGAFTDAKAERPGLVALAAGGTFFLDEVDGLSLKAQVTLLRFLQDREYRPVGGRRTERADVRIVAATNVDLAPAVAAGTFRQDLLFRLDVLAIDLPSLAQRREDISVLARFFLRRFAAIYGGPSPMLDSVAEAWLLVQPWPGNVRELENRMHRAFVLARNGRIGEDELEFNVAGLPKETPSALPWSEKLKEGRAREIWAYEERYLRELMVATHGNVSEAARRAGTERRAMGRLLKRHDIDRQNFCE
jgi:DNA-binding NtrC family response regulator